jgi:hypothetical protein
VRELELLALSGTFTGGGGPPIADLRLLNKCMGIHHAVLLVISTSLLCYEYRAPLAFKLASWHARQLFHTSQLTGSYRCAENKG